MHHGTQGRSAHWSGLERCASIWACPVCSAVIRAERSVEIQAAVDAWSAQQGHTLMVTGTLRHRLADPLGVGLEAAVTGWRNLTATRAFKRLRARFGVVGFVRSVEVTWTTANGWHPHVHALLFAERALAPGEVIALEDAIFEAWAGIVTRLGARRPDREHGIKITRGAADYLAKIQEHDRAGVEMTRFDLKRSRSASGFMPFELLDVAGTDQGRARRLWWEYVDATAGRRAITWSRGLKARFGLDDVTDEEVIEATDVDDLVLLVPAQAYDALLRNRPGRATAVLELLEAGDVHGAARVAGGLVRVESGGARSRAPASDGVARTHGTHDDRPTWPTTDTRSPLEGTDP